MIAQAEKGPQRVLVCDDERHIVRLIQVNLERQGHTVACAFGGREAIGWLQRETFDLALIDREMPDMDGLEVITWIRANEETKDLRVTLLTKERHPDDPSGPPGPDMYLKKPFNLFALLR